MTSRAGCVGWTSSEIKTALSGDTEDEMKIAKEIAATKASNT